MAVAIIAVSIYSVVNATEKNDLDDHPIPMRSGAYVYSINNPITPTSNPYTGNRALGFSIFVIEKKNSDKEWECLDILWGIKESGWKEYAQNPKSTAFGIAQFLNGTWEGTGYEKTNDPEIQVRAGIVYIEKRFYTACNALKYFNVYGWY